MKYFDYAASTPIDDDNLDLYVKISKEVFMHPGTNLKAKQTELDSKKLILETLGLSEEEYDIIYTSGGTEANNIVVHGFAKNFESPKHFVTTKFEHSSVLDTLEQVKKLGHKVSYVDIKKDGTVDLDDLKEKLQEDTVMVLMMAVQNEIGTRQPIEEAVDIVKAYNEDIVFFTDSIQAIGKVKFDYNKFDVMVSSGHKLYSTKAVGCIIRRHKVNFKPLVFGGGLEKGIRPGSQSVANQVAFAYAINKEVKAIDEVQGHVQELIKIFKEEIKDCNKLRLNVDNSVGTLSLHFDVKILNEAVCQLFAKEDMMMSARSACSTKNPKPSKTLLSIGMTEEEIFRSVRVSFSKHTSKQDVIDLARVAVKIANEN